MKTREFNLENWSGESTVVSYSVSKMSFYFQGETYFIEDLDCAYNQTFACRFGSNDNPNMTTVFIETDFNTPTIMEAAVIAAARWVANYV